MLTPALPPTGPDGPAAHLTERIVATLDAALAQYPNLDGERVGYLGHSFGGYAGLVLATETERIHSFVILSGPADLAASWGAFSGFGRANPEFGVSSRRGAGWAETGQGAMGGPPWAVPEVYRGHSPLYRADAIRAPVLLLHGELDFVPITEAESLFTALWRQDKDVQLVTYWGEHHLFVSPGSIRDAWARIDAWFARTLGVSPAGSRPAQ
ncbi:alpha/beta hydrolase family protein [Brevundimonas viscosa]|uniref:alpha/beta hydrolase family protein n=1 Tax=Brevundimonas viscosa TaxID=871741 RepID=UPI001FE6F633|nr:prolyl oligopeptidase family serine peptidase [Brevundimonas viscosa]